MTLGQKINQLRLEQNLSQNDLADMLNVSRQSISKWETDGSVPDLDNLIKLSQIFHVTLDELVLNKMPDMAVSAESSTATTTSLPDTSEEQHVQGRLSVRLLAGFALLICSAVGILICTILGDPAAGLVLMLPFMISA
ncbi:MAG: helix-turn-helix transcriptional regulator, partial [Firmicutes bacterium]|nr:helix-turn-helix transcriptional regulator [Bacillota bacterium]